MSTGKSARALFFGLVLLVFGFVLGIFYARDSSEIARLRSQLHAITNKAELPNVVERSRSIPEGLRNHSPGDQPRPLPESADETTEQLTARHERGEFILEYEWPLNEKGRREGIERIVARDADSLALEYNHVFNELGLKPEEAEQFNKHMSKVQKASLEAETAISQLLEARNAYEERLKEKLGPEGYATYKQYEASRPSYRELDNLRNYIQKEKKSGLDPRYEPIISSMITEAQAFSEKTWHGPLDGLPQVAVGVQNVVNQLEPELERLIENSRRLIDRSAQAGLPDETRSYISDYYAQRISEKRAVLDKLKERLITGERPSRRYASPPGRQP